MLAAEWLPDLAQAHAEGLVRDHGGEDYGEACQRERDVILPDGTHAGRTPAHWRRVALIVARMTGKRVGLDTSTRMAADAELSADQGSVDRRAHVQSLPPRPLDELRRILSGKCRRDRQG
jgi:hypothetical protein